MPGLQTAGMPDTSLHIALVSETFAPQVNGVAHTLQQLYRGLQARGHHLQLVRPRHPGEAACADRNLLLTRGWPLPGYPGLQWGHSARGKLLRQWRLVRPDVLYIATEGPLGWSALQAARQLQIPVVSGYHTNFQQYLDHYGLGLLERLLMHYLRCFHERCQATLVPSPFQHTELTRRGFHNLHLLGRGVDAQLFHPARRCHSLRQQWGVAEDELVVLYVGRLAAEKNLALLGRTFASLQQHAGQRRLRLVVVGDGPQAGQWRRQWPQAVFCGVKQGEELARHYASADLFVFPSLSETFGNVVLEALASGLAVIAYDQAAAAQYIRHGYNGVLAMPGDERGFIEAAGWLLDDGESRRRMRLNARREASQCGWPQIVEQFEALLRQATQNTLNTRQVAQRPAAGTLSRATSAPRD